MSNNSRWPRPTKYTDKSLQWHRQRLWSLQDMRYTTDQIAAMLNVSREYVLMSLRNRPLEPLKNTVFVHFGCKDESYCTEEEMLTLPTYRYEDLSLTEKEIYDGESVQ